METKNGVTTYSLKDKLNFGKHKGMTIEEVLIVFPSYIVWCSETIKWFKVSNSILRKAKIEAEKEEERFINAKLKKAIRHYTGYNYDPDCDSWYGAVDPYDFCD